MKEVPSNERIFKDLADLGYRLPQPISNSFLDNSLSVVQKLVARLTTITRLMMKRLLTNKQRMELRDLQEMKILPCLTCYNVRYFTPSEHWWVGSDNYRHWFKH